MTSSSPGLIADIGATNARFALVDPGGAIYDEKIMPCADYPGLREAAQDYLDQTKPGSPVKKAAFAVAGPVTGDFFKYTNRAWSFSINETKEQFGFDTFRVVNDFEAVSMCVPHLAPEDIRQIGGGTPVPKAPIGVLGPGTGLGTGYLTWDNTHYVAHAGEGGHMNAPVKTPRECVLLHEIQKHEPYVSAELVCSGIGLENLYNAIRICDALDLPDRTPAEISAAGISGECKACTETLDLMTGFLGTIAGNLALCLNARGGIYIAGGIPEKLGAYFDSSPFRSNFEDKGRLAGYVRDIPAFLITHPLPAFLGLQAEVMKKSE